MQPLKDLRSSIRRQRRQLTRQQQRQHSQAVTQHAANSRRFQNSQRIAFYHAADGEIDPASLVKHALECHKKIYLPVLRPSLHNTLWFAEYRLGDKLIPNRFGIPEPNIRRRKPIPPWALDLIYLPLVAFDSSGNRVGMGGGYYDRTLTYLRHRNCWHRPTLIGLAHECQKVTHLERQPWDIPLEGVITEAAYHVTKTAESNKQ